MEHSGRLNILPSASFDERFLYIKCVRRFDADNTIAPGGTAGKQHDILLAREREECRWNERMVDDMEIRDCPAGAFCTDSLESCQFILRAADDALR